MRHKMHLTAHGIDRSFGLECEKKTNDKELFLKFEFRLGGFRSLWGQYFTLIMSSNLFKFIKKVKLLCVSLFSL